MPLLSLAQMKAHLRVFDDYDDEQIALYQAAAEAIVIEHIDREVVATGEPTTADGISLVPPIAAAILLVAADLYENREPDMQSNGDAVLPKHVRALLAPYRVWRVLENA